MDLYEALGVPRDATLKQMKAAYRKLAQLHHPDKGGDADQFLLIKQAYETLSDPEKREHYDRYGSLKENKDLMVLAQQKVGSLFMQTMSGEINDYTDVIEIMRESIKVERQQLRRHLRQLVAEFKKGRKVKHRLTLVGKNDLILQLAASRRSDVVRAYLTNREQRNVLDLALLIVNDYEYQAEVWEPVSRWATQGITGGYFR